MIEICCDFCERVLPKEYFEDTEYSKTARTWEVKTVDIFPHLCPSCAEKLDMVVRKYKDSVTKERILAEQYARLNEERKKQTRSNG